VSAAIASLERLERQLGLLLVTGVLLSAACLGIGLLFYLTDGTSVVADRCLRTGLIVLMATPILRVVVSVVEYVRMRDWFFVATTVIVLAELAWTLGFAFTR
jgi:uncharacterized membrane protein